MRKCKCGQAAEHQLIELEPKFYVCEKMLIKSWTALVEVLSDYRDKCSCNTGALSDPCQLCQKSYNAMVGRV